ncbi:hypothetical protein NWF24_17550 [Variovorax paradoxus]|uniref:hypothetical protein n=1 Tax=Variovorax paradoxus TaxID=34073 RepID=UPI0021AC91E6|nr:hypothetical protein [Variovorax paradoxus]UVH54652.1 hypothetical protein NWF24_17550 [Variovorax paradoxus]
MANSSNVLTFAFGLLIVVVLIFAAIGYSFYLERGGPPDHSTRQLHFAAVTLTGLGMLFALSMAMYYWGQSGADKAGKEIFDGCKTVIPPIITLILGYYFGSKDGANGGTRLPPAAPPATTSPSSAPEADRVAAVGVAAKPP